MEGRLDKIRLDDDIMRTVVEKVGEISRFIEGHSHPDTFQRPSVRALQDEIEAFDKLKGEHKDLLRAAGKS